MRPARSVFLAVLFSVSVHTSPLEEDSLQNDADTTEIAGQPLDVGECCRWLSNPSHILNFSSASSGQIAPTQDLSDPVGLGISSPASHKVIPGVDPPKCGEPPNSPPFGGSKGLYCCEGGIDERGNGFDCIACKTPFFFEPIARRTRPIDTAQKILLTASDQFERRCAHVHKLSMVLELVLLRLGILDMGLLALFVLSCLAKRHEIAFTEQADTDCAICRLARGADVLSRSGPSRNMPAIHEKISRQKSSREQVYISNASCQELKEE